jgi:cyclopropane-fatty-acyl-phospholipid synthase
MFGKQILRQVFTLADEIPFKVIYWDQTSDTFGNGAPRFTLSIHDENILSDLHKDYEIALADAYVAGKWDIDGDVGEIVALAGVVLRRLNTGRYPIAVNLLSRIAPASGSRSLKKQREDVARHYDLGNEFYRLWLDESMSYSCAYFQDEADSLEAAQAQKIDHSLRKLRLSAGESLLDIGSGWGALLRRAVDVYNVRALGITLSREQLAFASDSIHANGIEDRADVRLENYLTLVKDDVRFDKITSIGMVEHVGKAHLADFSHSVAKLLKPGGLALLHFITSPKEGPFCSWMDKRIFPGAYLPTLPEMIGHFSDADLRVLDVENLRPHYRLTLDRWSERFEQHVSQIRQMFGDEFVRMWRLYLRGCSASFREGFVEIHQILVSNGNMSGAPLTRCDMYR